MNELSQREYEIEVKVERMTDRLDKIGEDKKELQSRLTAAINAGR